MLRLCVLRKCVPLNEYSSKFSCNPFWFFRKHKNRIVISLDNPNYFVPRKTDIRLEANMCLPMPEIIFRGRGTERTL